MKRLGQRLMASCLAVTVLATTACDTDARGEGAGEERRVFTGEEVFEGMFLGIGPVAELVPELFEVDPALLNDADREQAQRTLADDRTTPVERAQARRRLADDAAFVELEAELFAWIHAEDPTFMERFGDAMQSGDHVEIDEMLDEALVVLGAVRSTHPEAFGQLTDEGHGTGALFTSACILYFFSGGWAALSCYFIWWGGGADKQRNPLARERAVDLLAEQLSVEQSG